MVEKGWRGSETFILDVLLSDSKLTFIVLHPYTERRQCGRQAR